tara:strand:- start:72251 stop:73336 length:1086 start_codon:yes stop_codon:yes gene_type:complete
MNNPLKYWLALLHVQGMGPATLAKWLAHADISELFSHSASQLRALGLKDNIIESIAALSWGEVEKDLTWAEQDDQHVITLGDDAYPYLLKDAATAPMVLFVKGDVTLLQTPQIAMVGSRNPTSSGRETAAEFAHSLTQAGLVVTSGLALGVDGACHEGALKSGKTIAVMGTGLNRVYPAKHKSLAHDIVTHGGALVSEFLPDESVSPKNFPRRNRIISGMSLGTVVVEAALRSGSLITARYAMEQGREVFAIPGSIHNPLAKGCHWLIKQGAKLVETANDIIEELGPIANVATVNAVSSNVTPIELDDDYQQLLNHIDFDPISTDAIIQRSGLKPEQVASMLLILELKGCIQNNNSRYIRT